jgi:hypothetical protein
MKGSNYTSAGFRPGITQPVTQTNLCTANISSLLYFPEFRACCGTHIPRSCQTFVLEPIGDITQYIEDRLERFSSLVVASYPTMIKVDDIVKSGNTGVTSGDISPRSVADLRRASIDAASHTCSSLEYFFEKDKRVIR